MTADLWKSLLGGMLVATLGFMTVAAATVYVVRHGVFLWHS